MCLYKNYPKDNSESVSPLKSIKKSHSLTGNLLQVVKNTILLKIFLVKFSALLLLLYLYC